MLFVLVFGLLGFLVLLLFVLVFGLFGFLVLLFLVLVFGLLGFLVPLFVGCFSQGGGVPLAARSLIARLQVCDIGRGVTVGVLFWFLLSVWFLLNVGVLDRFIVCVFLHVGLLGLLFVRFWAEG